MNFILDQLNWNSVSVKASNVFPVTFEFKESVSIYVSKWLLNILRQPSPQKSEKNYNCTSTFFRC